MNESEQPRKTRDEILDELVADAKRLGETCDFVESFLLVQEREGAYNPQNDYRIIVSPIVDAVVFEPTPSGRLAVGFSKLESGFQVAVKERMSDAEAVAVRHVEDKRAVYNILTRYVRKYHVELPNIEMDEE